MARLLLGVSGGIAAYKALETARLAVKASHSVRVIQTPTSERFVGRASFEGITGAPVLVSEFEPDPARGSYPGEPLPERAPISHLALVERAELYLIAPASANTIAKLATRQADKLLTREPIDSVRYIGNRSSGRMGFALATEAVRRGADVTVVAANVALPRPAGAKVLEAGTAAELRDVCLNRFDACDVLLMAAAVADFPPANPA